MLLIIFILIGIPLSLFWLCCNVANALSEEKDAGHYISRIQFLGYCLLLFTAGAYTAYIVFGLLHDSRMLHGFEELFFALILILAGLFVLSAIWQQYKKYKECFPPVNIDGGNPLVRGIKAIIIEPEFFIESYSFIEFVQMKGSKVGKVSHINRLTKKTFYTLEIQDSTGKTTSVRFHSSLGELSVEQLKERKAELFVGKKTLGHRWYLYDKSFNERNWKEVNLEVCP